MKFDWQIFWSALEAIGTISAALAALFLPSIQKRFFGPKLEILFDQDNPNDRTRNGTFIEFFGFDNIDPQDQKNLEKEKINIRIKNIGKNIAKNVRISIPNVLYYDSSPTIRWKPYLDTSGMLFPKWNNTDMHKIDICPDEERRILIAYAKYDQGQKIYLFDNSSTGSEFTDLKIQVFSDNADTVEKHLIISFDNDNYYSINGKLSDERKTLPILYSNH